MCTSLPGMPGAYKLILILSSKVSAYAHQLTVARHASNDDDDDANGGARNRFSGIYILFGAAAAHCRTTPRCTATTARTVCCFLSFCVVVVVIAVLSTMEQPLEQSWLAGDVDGDGWMVWCWICLCVCVFVCLLRVERTCDVYVCMYQAPGMEGFPW